jgi:hypothetical protein
VPDNAEPPRRCRCYLDRAGCLNEGPRSCILCLKELELRWLNIFSFACAVRDHVRGEFPALVFLVSLQGHCGPRGDLA